MGFTPQQKKAAQVQREKRRNRVAALYLEGCQSYRKIGARIGVSYQTVRRDLEAVRTEWQEHRVADFETARDEIRQRLLWLLSEAGQAWERSKLEREKSRTRRKVRPEKGNGQDGDVVQEDWAELEKEKRVGDPRYLERMESVVDRLARLDGCYKPLEVKHGGAVSLTVLQIVRQLEEGEAAEVIDVEWVEGEVKRLTDEGPDGV